jgi:hypothetical protein
MQPSHGAKPLAGEIEALAAAWYVTNLWESTPHRSVATALVDRSTPVGSPCVAHHFPLPRLGNWVARSEKNDDPPVNSAISGQKCSDRRTAPREADEGESLTFKSLAR